MRHAILVTLFMIIATSAISAPYTLTCQSTDSGLANRFNLTVDLDQKTMTFAQQQPNFTITSITDRYITATEDPIEAGDVGGEFWVPDRSTGEYKRAFVGLFCRNASCKPRDDLVLRAFTTSGKCSRPIL